MEPARPLRLLTWPGMPEEGAIREATRRLGRVAEIDEVASNELLEARLGSEQPYDLIFPSDYLIERLLAGGRLLEAGVPGFALERLARWARQESYDPGCRFTVPFAFGTTGYLCDAGAEGQPSWRALFEPPEGCRVGMLAEIREVAGAALIVAGHDPNAIDAAALAAAGEVLQRQRAAVARYDSDEFIDPVLSGDVVVQHAWSGPASKAVRESSRLRYVVPSEGAMLWVTSAAIPADAPDPDLSRALLVELMDPELAARTTARNGYATPNTVARRLLSSELRDDPTLFCDSATRARCARIHDLGPDEARLAAIVAPLLA